MASFKQIADYVRRVEPSQSQGSINYCGMIAELAEALDRLEHNTAVHLAVVGHPACRATRSHSANVHHIIELLRAEVTDGQDLQTDR